MKRALLLIFAISLCSVTYAYSAPKVSYGNNQPTTCNPANGDFWIDTNGTAGNRLYICTGTNTYTLNDGLASTKAPALGADDNYVTDSEKIKLSNLTGTNTGDQNAAGVSVADAGGYYTGTNVEAILQEIGLAGFGGGSVDLSAYLSKTNTTPFTPSGDYHPATKKYVDDSITAGGGYTDEQAQDAVGGMFTGNTETGITVTYDDTTGKVNFVVATQSDVNFTSTLNTKLAGIATGAEANVNADWDSVSGDSQILNKPTETPISASIVANLFTGTGDCLGKNGEAVACGGAVGDLDGLTDVVITGTPTTGYVLKYNGTNWVPAADATAAGAGYVSTPPTYSDAACTAGQYASSTSPLRLYSCLGNKWVYTDSTGLVDWTNLTPVTRTFTFTQPTNGVVTSASLPTLNCGTGHTNCTVTGIADGTVVTDITATADSGYEFTAFGGDVTGATYNSGSVTFDANKTGSVTFSAIASGAVYTQDWEGTGAPSGWGTISGQDAPNYDYTTTTHEGTQALYLSSGAGAQYSGVSSWNTDGSIGVSFWVYIPTNITDMVLFRVENGTGGISALGVTSTGGGRLKGYHGSIDQVASQTIVSPNTWYKVWVYSVDNSGGGNGIVRAYISTSGTRPGSPDIHITTGNSANTIPTILHLAGYGHAAMVDDFKGDADEISD